MLAVVESYNFADDSSAVLCETDDEAICYAERRWKECMKNEEEAQAELPEEMRTLLKDQSVFDKETGTGTMVWRSIYGNSGCEDCPFRTNSTWTIEVVPVIKPKC